MMAPRLAETALAAGVALVVLTAEPVDAGGLQVSGTPPFSEAAWPFLIDQWGGGRAFRCDPCGAQLALYVRTKVGFCNCTIGVSDDIEIDRVADFDLFPGRVTPLAPGEPVKVAWMNGRARAFSVDPPLAARRYLLTIALANKCDGVIATLASAQPISSDAAQV
ncbi:MAG: hypothetical protein WAL48_22235, partial [Xanthobacteraceae bacterium]